MDLLTEVSDWLAPRGIQQWPSPPPPAVDRLVAREIAAGEVYLVRLSGGDVAVGLLRFEWHDPYLWPNDPDGAGYVHSLALRPVQHGQRLGPKSCAGRLNTSAPKGGPTYVSIVRLTTGDYAATTRP